MKYKIRPIVLSLGMISFALVFALNTKAQERIQLSNPAIIQGTLERISPKISTIEILHDSLHEIVRTAKPGYHPKKDWPLHDKVNEQALPQGIDPAMQLEYMHSKKQEKKAIVNFPGIGNTNVDPADPTLDVGPNHVVQMVNGGSGSYIQVFDKNGNTLINKIYFDQISGISGGGDPIVIYDQLADRWLISEFKSGWTAKQLVVGISQTPDPTGSYYIYSYNTPNFPDYPKYAIWPEAYVITTNESSGKVYAIDRQTMLSGSPTTTMIDFSVPDYPTIGFQAPTPVSLSGTTLPPAGTPAYIMRMADDAWSTSVPNDRLEMWELQVNFQNPSASTFSGPTFLATDPFDTHLCGYTSFACFPQPASGTTLDPLREVLMNRIFYRNFGTHQSIVCNHVTDVDGTDHGGIRWYELRNNGLAWTIHQQSTYAPDNDNRWMASIGINAQGDIGLAYNVSSTSTYPSLRYTGRRACDPLNSMTMTETTLKNGGGSNWSNRYGDYNTLVVDAANETDFWFTGMFNPSSQWSTQIGAFNLGSCFSEAAFDAESTNILESDAIVQEDCQFFKDYYIKVILTAPPASEALLVFNLTDTINASTPSRNDVLLLTDSLKLDSAKMEDFVVVRVYDDARVEGTRFYKISMNLFNPAGDVSPGAPDSHLIRIEDNDTTPVVLVNEVEQSITSIPSVYVQDRAWFFNPSNHKILASVYTSNPASELGCLSVNIGREGAEPWLTDFRYFNEKSGILHKTFTLDWTVGNAFSDPYTIELYYSKEEIDAWKNQTSIAEDSLYIFGLKNADISSINPSNIQVFDIQMKRAQRSAFGNDYIFSASFNEPLKSFGLGLDRLPEMGTNEPFRIFPNPTEGAIYVQSAEAGIINVEVIDLMGRKVFEGSSEEQFFMIDLGELQEGIYVVRMIQNDIIESRNIKVEH